MTTDCVALLLNIQGRNILRARLGLTVNKKNSLCVNVMGVHNKDSEEIQTQEFLENNPIFAAFGQSLFVL